MIVGIADQATQDIFDGSDTAAARRFPKTIWAAARRKLDMVNAAHDVLDLRAPPGNRLEKLKGKLVGKYSIRINDQFRIVFDFANGNAGNVTITDYH